MILCLYIAHITHVCIQLIGEELARMWEQDALLLVFQSLEMNARWWKVLSSHGVKIDARAFQNSDTDQREASMRAIIPDLLTHTNLNLELAYDYCQQFNLEPELATICYIEQLFLLPPSNSSAAPLASAASSTTTSNTTHRGPIASQGQAYGGHNSWTRLIQHASTGIHDKILITAYRKILTKIDPLDYEKINYCCC